jgi:hypothetical protein
MISVVHFCCCASVNGVVDVLGPYGDEGAKDDSKNGEHNEVHDPFLHLTCRCVLLCDVGWKTL